MVRQQLSNRASVGYQAWAYRERSLDKLSLLKRANKQKQAGKTFKCQFETFALVMDKVQTSTPFWTLSDPQTMASGRSIERTFCLPTGGLGKFGKLDGQRKYGSPLLYAADKQATSSIISMGWPASLTGRPEDTSKHLSRPISLNTRLRVHPRPAAGRSLSLLVQKSFSPCELVTTGV